MRDEESTINKITNENNAFQNASIKIIRLEYILKIYTPVNW